MYYLTNYTSFNCDPIQAFAPGSPATAITGTYDVWFRSASSTTNYYITGSVGGLATDWGVMTLPVTPLLTTNYFQIQSARLSNETLQNFGLIMVLVNPQ